MGIDRKKVLSLIFKKNYKPLTIKGLQKALNVYKEEDVKELYLLLSSLEEDGSLFKTSRGRYCPQGGGTGALVGVLQGHSRGYAFLLPETPGEADIFIPKDRLKGAMHKDRVLVRLRKGLHNGRRREGEVLRILERGNTNVVATYYGNRNKGIALPDDQRISEIGIPRGSRKAGAGDKIVVSITRWPDRSNARAEGKIIEIIGAADEPGVDITSIQKKFGLPSTFPARVLKEAEKLDEKHILETAREEGRLDLRELPMVTIDVEDAKDLDDAVSLEKKESGYRLGVHIADVSYYVRENSALDREAAKRATSVYFPDRVIPMLPPRLSNGICSLNPGVPRLAMSVFMELDDDGTLEGYSYHSSVILVNERLTYSDVNSILKGNSGAVNKSEGTNFVETLKNMDQLAKKLKEKRNRRGALDFNLPEAKVKLDSRGKPVEITVRVSEGAESMIEEFMLLCNEVIATHLYKRQHPCIYRVHERPEEKKLYALRDFLTLFDIKMEGNLGRVSPRQFQKIMDTVKNTPVERIVNYVLLRSLPQAWYSVSPLGHFGLALRYYAHFTAPIRRYPDLLVHRVLHSTLKKPRTAEASRKLVARLSQLAFHSSEQERVAMEAERECLDLKKVEFMEDKVGNEYSGIISGVTSFGFFVELENTIEGLVHVTSLQDDYYTFNEKRYELVGERSRKVYRLGDSVKVLLEKVSRETRTIYFTPNP